MTAREFKDWMERNKLSYAQAGALLGINTTTAWRYATEKLPIPDIAQLAIEAVENRWQRDRRTRRQ